MSNLKLIKEDLLAIILLINKTNTISIADDQEIMDFKMLVPGVIAILLVQCFGEYNSKLIWNYATNSDKNKFNSIDELYDYLNDPYSRLVTDKALSLKELLKIYPEYKTLIGLKNYIDEEVNSKNKV